MSNEEGVPLDQLLKYVERAMRGDMELHMQLLATMRQLANHPTAPPEERALGDVLMSVLLGQKDPDLSKLPAEAEQEVRALLQRLESSAPQG